MTQGASGKPEQFVSIVIRAYHGGRNLFRTLESCISLDYDRCLFEVIIVRDRDDLESKRTIEEFAQCYSKACVFPRVIESEENSATKAWNAGIRSSRGEIVFVCPDDIIIHPSSVRHVLSCLSDDDTVGALTFVAVPEENDLPWGFRLGHMKYLGLCSMSNTIFAVSVYRKSSIEKAGMYREDMGPPLSIHEDWELGARMNKCGFKVVVDGTLRQLHMKRGITQSGAGAKRETPPSSLRGLALEFTRYAESYVGKHWWSMLQVFKVGSASLRATYIFYLLNQVLFLILLATTPLFALAQLLTVGGSVIAWDATKGYYKVFSLRERLAYPVILLIVRSVRVDLFLVGLLRNRLLSALVLSF